MATVVRKTDPAIVDLCTAHNNLKAQIGAGSHFHLDASEVTVVAADGDGTLATLLTLVNQCRAVFLFHKADTVGGKAVDTTSFTAAAATDLATATTLINALKTGWATHIASTSFNYNADSTNTVLGTTDGSQGQNDTLATAFKAALNAHMANAPSAASFRIVDA